MRDPLWKSVEMAQEVLEVDGRVCLVLGLAKGSSSRIIELLEKSQDTPELSFRISYNKDVPRT